MTPGGRDCPGADGAAGHLAPLQRAEFAPAPGQRLAGDHRPGAAPGYLFLHGLGSVRTGEKSESLFAHAAANGRACTRVDFRGHGESTGDFGEVTFSELIADALAVLGHLGPTVVVGSSLGALVGAFAAAARPDLVAGLALLAPALGFVSRLEQRVDADGRITTTDGRGFLLAPRVLADARTHDERALPGRITVPTLVVHGTADEVLPARASEQFFAALAARPKELWIVPDAGHRLNTVAAAIWPRLDALLRRAAP